VARRPNATLVGTFIVVGVLLFVAAIAVWAPTQLLGRQYRYVCYFPGSVNGLGVGAQVRFRGVPVGSVVGIRIRFQQPADDFRVAVFIELSGRRAHALGALDEPTPDVIANLVRAGFRARLDSDSFVTGLLYVALDFLPETPIRLVHGGYPEIPTVPRPLEQVSQSVSTLLLKLDQADIAGAVRSFSKAADSVSSLVGAPQLAHTIGALPQAVASVEKVAKDIDEDVGRVGKDVDATLDARGPLAGEVRRTLAEIQRTADAVRQLAEFLRRNPNALIVGRKRP
jgi:paraquat-inducible protein B